jgi:hypothetical protein
MNLCNITGIGTSAFSAAVTNDMFTVTSGTYGTSWTSNITGGRKYYTFYSNCTITCISSGSIEYFAVGGGGGGSGGAGTQANGGGGAGGLQTNASSSSFQVTFSSQYFPLPTFAVGANYAISIGEGGLPSTNGGNTTISGTGVFINSTGGGKGGTTSGFAGGCGGGGTSAGAQYPGGTGSQGGNGGTGNTGSQTYYLGAGGGGIGGNGFANTNSPAACGIGGTSRTYNGVAYGGGGGGGGEGAFGAAGGGAGAGAGGDASVVGGNASSNTGSGGGGGGTYRAGGSGGSGIVLMSYAFPSPTTIFSLGSVYIDVSNSLRLSATSNIVVSSSSLIIQNPTSISGSLEMNYCNITNIGSNTFSGLVPITPDLFTVTSGTQGTSWTSNVSGGRKYYTFYSNCTVTVGVSAGAIEYFALGGGGGGGTSMGAGGGGAGGLQTNVSSTTFQVAFSSQYTTIPSLSANSNYTIAIGAGGGGGSNGSNTTIVGTGISITASGGGSGASTGSGAAGGCGGGAANNSSVNLSGAGQQGGGGGGPGTGIPGSVQFYLAGGGGGIGGKGGDVKNGGFGGDGSNSSGNGGTTLTFNGSAYGGGGGGAGGFPPSFLYNGTGGGATAGAGNCGGAGGSASANTGSGGGGGSNVGGSGGSGIVIISYPFTSGFTITPLGTVSIDSSSNLKLSATSNIVVASPTTFSSNITVAGTQSNTGTATVSSLVVTYTSSHGGISTFGSNITVAGTQSNTYSGNSPGLTISGTDTLGGAGYMNFLRVTNTSPGVTNPTKTFRLDSVGTLQLINNGYSSTLLAITDGGALTISDTFLFSGKNVYIGGSTTGYGGITAAGDGGYNLWWGSSGNGGANDRLWRFAWQNDRNVVIYTGVTANWSTGTSTSDGRLKTSIVKTSLCCTDIVMTTDVVDFEWKAESDLADGGKIHTGFIAQDLEGRIPDAVKDVGGTKLLHKEELVPILWKALQDTINRVAVLEQTISSLISQR